MIAIEKDIPYIPPAPPDNSLPHDWPMDDLEVGDSFVTAMIGRLDMILHHRNWSRMLSPLHKKTFSHQELEVENGRATYRIWRTK